MAQQVSSAEIAAVARRLFADGPGLASAMQRWRPAICPFELLLPWIPPGARVLDVGCGAGLFLGLLAELSEIDSAIGFDANRRAIALANRMRQKVNPAARPRLEFRQLNVSEPWPDGPFDIVSLVDVLHHVPRRAQQAVLTHAAKRLSPGGTLIYKDIGPWPLWRATANRLHDLVVARQLVHLRNSVTITSWLAQAGLRRVHYERANRLWYAHDVMVFEPARQRVIDAPQGPAAPHTRLPTPHARQPAANPPRGTTHAPGLR